LLFAIESGLQCRSEKRDPFPDLLTSSAFTVTDPMKTANFPEQDFTGLIPPRNSESFPFADNSAGATRYGTKGLSG